METRSESSTNYYQNLLEKLGGFLNTLLQGEGFLFWNSQKVVTVPAFAKSNDFHLMLIGKTELETGKGTFNVMTPEKDFLVFRNPSKVKTQFCLYSANPSVQTRMEAHDKLSCHFFDHRMMEPILPSSLTKHPGLHQALLSQKAEVILREDLQLPFSLPERNINSFCLGIDYTALYHSGNPVREERRVRERVIDYSKLNERSV